MSLQIGQITKNNIPSIDDEKDKIKIGNLEEIDIDQNGLKVKDLGFTVKLNKNQNYYLSFEKQYSQYDFTIVLKGEKNEMPLKYFPNNLTGKCELMFAPNSNEYTHLVFKIERTANNIGEIIPTSSIQNINLFKLLNLISDNKNIKQLGIQAPPGKLFCLNGEEIRIGKSRRYEVSDITINNLATLDNNKDTDNEMLNYIVIDYLYEKGSV